MEIKKNGNVGELFLIQYRKVCPTGGGFQPAVGVARQRCLPQAHPLRLPHGRGGGGAPGGAVDPTPLRRGCGGRLCVGSWSSGPQVLGGRAAGGCLAAVIEGVNPDPQARP